MTAEPVQNADPAHFEAPIQSAPEQTKRRLSELEEALPDLTRQRPKRARVFDILCSIPGADHCGRDLGRAPGNRRHDPQANRQPRGPRTDDPTIRPAARQGVHPGRFLRDTLYMASLVAGRYDPDLRRTYQTKIQAGKPANAALASTLIKQDRNWTPKTA